MGRKPRRTQIDLSSVTSLHLYSRCVRALFLIGKKGANGKFSSERKQWIEDRQNRLFAVYAIDLVGFAMMDNHMHHVVITRPDLAQLWTNEQVIERWYRIHHAYNAAGKIVQLTEELFQEKVNDAQLVAELRVRLCNPSWLMKDLKENIAHRCNAEDEVTGRFWDDRFRSVNLLDFIALVMCLIYVDLNPVHASVVEVPEDYEHASAQRRVEGYKSRLERGDQPAAGETLDADAALVPIPEDGEPGNQTAPEHRASNRGVLPLRTDQYLATLDWAGRLLRGDKRGAIPADVAPILERVGTPRDRFANALDFYGSLRFHAVGHEETMRAVASSRGQLWLRGVTIAASVAAN